MIFNIYDIVHDMKKKIQPSQYTPLSDRIRPRNFDEFVGQEEIVGKGKLLRKMVESDQLSSIVFWGPPGVGKTSLANIIAKQTSSEFVSLSGVESGKKDLMSVVKNAQDLLKTENKRTILFIDEIHRWNKAQQDALLPYVERGVITLIGATTENPSFEIIRPLLSRSRVFILKSLSDDDIVLLIKQALEDKERGLGKHEIKIEAETVEMLAELSGGDGRVALNGLELAFKSKVYKAEKSIIVIGIEDIREALQRTHLVFDKKGEEFYNLISALHKSMRGSDANASLYWLARMLEGGADPLYIARRILRFASEDIGMANSEAMVQANTAFDACHKIGYPECSVHLAQAVIYCAKSTKSNLLYRAYGEAAKDAQNTSYFGVPLHLRNASTDFMKNIGYGKDYKYNPDFEGEVEQDYLPEELRGKDYFKKVSM
ncbi:MAG: AAA family ATPase [Candidatus Magasanikbacteria bacterium CG_4_10_14_0_2_um_filter_37_12]|uniref:Replication-associated recombination protein A n=1 Tax=Candidatus Magasanikbacteria bacterium CG_4_10_14_0_2_um_filter_37_12 TaxID=1974637 RepID=A0A2M7V6Y7_9BACT|nr:MAG: AAA family ATPase [Candidatus Magasanikbacteria bacterium CG_4_10_14_0_2_um_filter_37_12]